MDPGKVAHLLALMLGPTVAVGAAVHLPAAFRAVDRWVRNRRRESAARPVGPPIERLADDLRRLLAEHEAVTRSTHAPLRATRLTALRGAITDCATDAARAVGVESPPRVGRTPLPLPDLALLLHRLTAAGLVLPGHEHLGPERS